MIDDHDLPHDALVIARIDITRYLTQADPSDVTVCRAMDGDGNQLPLVEALGMLRVTEDSVIRSRLGQFLDDDDDDDG